jgi:hypothetical protein
MHKNYQRIDSIFDCEGIYNDLEILREKAEMQGFKYEYECQDFINRLMERDYPKFFKWIGYNLDEDILTEYHEFEEDEEGYIGYAVYIHISEKFRKSVERKFPECFI